MVEQKSQIEL